MKLSFRYQFILAPFTIVVILACLIAYTLFALTKINNENEVTRQWEILTDSIQAMISSATQLDKVVDKLSSVQDIQQDEYFFIYLEQAGILADSFQNSHLLGRLEPELRQQILNSRQLFIEPENQNPAIISGSLTSLLPALEQQYKLFAAQRRSAFINNHRKLVAISSEMTTVLLMGLILCIILATGLALWGFYATRRRLRLLTQRAHTVCTEDNLPLSAPATVHDELDELEICLANMTSRLLNIVNAGNVLSGVEDERRRIAMDMHDGVLADLTSINRKLDNFNEQSNKQELAKSLRADIDDSINNLRCIIDDLHPQVLETLGLESALRSFLDRHITSDANTNIHFEFDQNIEHLLSLDKKINLFRIVVEAITNVIKHAHCDRLEVCIRNVSQQLIVTVEDNGYGMPENIESTGHGFANIAERAHLIGASMHWRAARFSRGTCFELNLPLKQNERHLKQ